MSPKCCPPPPPIDTSRDPDEEIAELSVTLTVFDPALCCSTGVCGPEVDPSLVRFAADLEWLRARGVDVRRFNLAQEPAAFAGNARVRRKLQEEGTSCLPLLLAGTEVVSSGRYPDRDELAGWSEMDAGADAACRQPTAAAAREATRSTPASAGLVVPDGGRGDDSRSTPRD